MRHLNVWWDEHYVGRFTEDDDGNIDLQYDDNAPKTPISLSLPKNGDWHPLAPKYFLENLLPADRNSRYALMDSLGKDSIESFDLLDRVDATGGLVFSSRDERPVAGGEPVAYADDADIAQRIRSISRMGHDWWVKDPRCRFSIAGGQGKFTLTRIGGKWAFPNASLPSTHIFKPEPRDTAGAIDIEYSSMKLARMCGVRSAEAGILEVDGCHAYMVKRFDRELTAGGLKRLHMEDFEQAMGMSPDSKYDAEAEDCIQLLNGVDSSKEMTYDWIRQLAFNASIGNCDAHAKNYSLMLSPQEISLSPAYDLISTRYWVNFDQELAMTISGEEFPEWVDEEAWARLAKENDLDEDRVVQIASDTAFDVQEHLDEAYEGASPDIRSRMHQVIDKVNEKLISPMPKAVLPSFGGRTWVAPYVKADGTRVRGYWKN